MDIKILKNFLIEANKNTYANKNALKSESSRLKSEDYHFEKDGLIYHDTYFGGRDFIGEEIVYENHVPAWGANYFGFIVQPDTKEQEVYDFLRKALMQESKDIIPVRGPAKFSEDEWDYKFAVKGNLSNFSGEEIILFKNAIVYRCLIHGGYIN